MLRPDEGAALIAAVEAGYLRRDAWQAWAERRMRADGAIPPWLHALSTARDVDDALAALWEGLHESERANDDALTVEIDGTSLRLGFLFLRHQRGEIDLAALLPAAGDAHRPSGARRSSRSTPRRRGGGSRYWTCDHDPLRE